MRQACCNEQLPRVDPREGNGANKSSPKFLPTNVTGDFCRKMSPVLADDKLPLLTSVGDRRATNINWNRAVAAWFCEWHEEDTRWSFGK
jgi:hypothetical protein